MDPEYPGQIVGETITPERDPALKWVLEGLDRDVPTTCTRFRAGPEAGDDAGLWFYELYFTECSLAIRADCLSAYVARVSKLASLAKLSGLVADTGLAGPVELSADRLRDTVMAAERRWVLLASGEEARPEGGIDFCAPGDGSTPLSAATLLGRARSLQALDSPDEISDEELWTMRADIAMPGDVLGRVRGPGDAYNGRDVFGRILSARGQPGPPGLGSNVERRGELLHASAYGYVLLEPAQVAVVSPVRLGRETSVAHWYALDPRPHAVSSEIVGQALAEMDVVDGIDDEAIAQVVSAVNAGDHDIGRHPIAEVTAVEHGEDGYLDMIADAARRKGQFPAEGRVDLTGISCGADIRAGQELAHLVPPTLGTDGYSLMGDPLPARPGRALGVQAGPNVRAEDGADGITRFYATADGALKVTPSEIDVVDGLTLPGDVDLGTGNIDFAGEATVKGSVRAGFSLRASASVYVFGSIEAGTSVVAGADAIVGEAIRGRRTRVAAEGEVRVGYVEDARVRAAGDVLIGNHATNATIQADGVVRVVAGDDPQSGTICGGEVSGLAGIEAVVAGSRDRVLTTLVAGMSPDVARKLDLLNRKLAKANKLITRHLASFDLQSFDREAVRKRLMASTGPQRRVLSRAARTLVELLEARQKLVFERKYVGTLPEADLQGIFIDISGPVFPGVQVRIGTHKRLVESPMQRVVFRIRNKKVTVS